MPFLSEVTKVLEDNKTTPLDAYQKVRELLTDACREGGRFDPLKADDDWKEGRDGYHTAHNWFKKHKLYFASEKLLTEWWNYLGELQYSKNQRVYRAESAFLLSDLYFEMGENGIALRWAMHMQADDILGEHSSGGGAGRQTLTTLYGMSQSSFEELNQIATKCLSEINNYGGDWSQPAGFPEDAICRFAQSREGFALAKTTSEFEFPISKGYLLALLSSVDIANTNKEKGESLENVAFYLSILLPGCIPHKNVRAIDRIFETDILVQNLSPNPNVFTETMGRNFLVECKNWSKKLGVAKIGYFLYRMKLTHTPFGILFASQGVTGTAKNEAGIELIRRAFQEDDSVCIVISRKDLDKLATSEEISFWWMLLRKIEELRYGKSKSQ